MKNKNKNKKVQKEEINDWLSDVLEVFVVAMSISVFIYVTLAVPNQVDGKSMEPSFHSNELLITNKVSSWLGDTEVGKSLGLDYQRGDVVIFHKVHRKGYDLIKRIIAGPGDEIRFFLGKIFINGKELIEDYLPNDLLSYAYGGGYAFILENETKKVPEGSYFVMGDNRGDSRDSRFNDIGFVKRNEIRGKVMLRYWPFNEFVLFKTGVYTEK